MANTVTLKRKINSIKNTRQITKAMELVSASKMKKAQAQALASRDYRNASNNLLSRLARFPEIKTQPLFEKRRIDTRIYLVITSNTGLAGAYNSNVFKLLSKEFSRDKKDGVKSQVIAIGNKGANFVRKIKDVHVDLLAAYPELNDEPQASDIRPLLENALNSFREGSADEVRIIYTHFKSQLSQEVNSQIILPVHPRISKNPVDDVSKFEPDVETVLESTAMRLVEAQLSQAITESLASEHSMRMMAMKNATDNANDLIDDYTLDYNSARQSAITQELAEITGGVEALKE